MPTLYLHIGTPKTGTTALQNFLPANEEVLEQHGICYPDFGFRYTGLGVHRNGHFLVTGNYKMSLVTEFLKRKKQIIKKA